MGHIQRYALTNAFSVRPAKKPIECQIYHTPEARQVKMASDFPHLCQLIPIQTCVSIYRTTMLNLQRLDFFVLVLIIILIVLFIMWEKRRCLPNTVKRSLISVINDPEIRIYIEIHGWVTKSCNKYWNFFAGSVFRIRTANLCDPTRFVVTFHQQATLRKTLVNSFDVFESLLASTLGLLIPKGIYQFLHVLKFLFAIMKTWFYSTYSIFFLNTYEELLIGFKWKPCLLDIRRHCFHSVWWAATWIFLWIV